MRPNSIVSHPGLVGIIGGAPLNAGEVSQISPLVHGFVAADGGADHLLAAGIAPLSVVGDLDSLSPATRATFANVLCHIPEQSTTDFEKVLSRISAGCVLALGFTGGRMDHALSVLNVLTRYPDQPVILLGADDASFLVGQGGMTLHLPIGCRLSLMPLADVRVRARGLQWPLEDVAMQLTGFVSPSNAVAQPVVTLEADGPVLVTIPRAHLAAALQAVVPE